MWVVMKMQKFEFETFPRVPFPVTVDVGKCIGYLPMYATREDAAAEFPNGPFVEVEARVPAEVAQ